MLFILLIPIGQIVVNEWCALFNLEQIQLLYVYCKSASSFSPSLSITLSVASIGEHDCIKMDITAILSTTRVI